MARQFGGSPLYDYEIRRRRLPLAGSAAVLIAVALLYAQMLALGGDSAALAACAAAAAAVLAPVVLLLMRPAESILVRALPCVGLLLLAMLWAALPATGLAGSAVPRPAPDLLPLELAKFVGFVACVVIGVAIGSGVGATRRFCDLFVVFGLAYVLLSLWMLQENPGAVWGIARADWRPRFSGTMFNANVAACVFAVIAIVAWGRLRVLLKPRSRARTTLHISYTVVVAFAAAMATAACAMTGSRFVLVVLMAATLISLAGAARDLLRSHNRNPLIPMLALGVAVVALLLIFGEPVFTRFRTASTDLDLRMFAIPHFAGLATTSPWFGYGLGAFEAAHLASLDPQSAPVVWSFGAAHNALVEAAIEGGWPYVALISLAVAYVLWRVARAARRGPGDAITTSFVTALAAILLCAMIDIALSFPAVAAMSATMLGLVLGRAERTLLTVRDQPA
ncbi:O-antigen ligase family protein [Sphingomonas immobilis]|uniref:O-antigen ligase family protein n=1 Tax=Sphingomonas immobilis TaxID=3063997 RepID=A0ABT9A5T4_9SPHN|nr:O-antigen ligase family protein [Sphingomonas sp. CA1-15]MDO7844595.1 O-antigen ligase family protein [Sphingomonas sp. CA1-15]